MRPQKRKVAEVLAELAARSHGVVGREELRAAGITAAQVKGRVRAGSLLPLHRGVYGVGYRAASLEARYLAAVKAVGDEALLAGRAAGRLLGLLRGSPPPEVITKGQRRPTGVVIHRAAGIRPTDATRWLGVPVTTVQRTIVDLAAVLEEDQLARAFHEADVRHHTTPDQVEAVLGRRHNWPGARKLRRVIWGAAPVSLSRLESRFLECLRATGLPLPETNRRIDGRYVDCRWPRQRLTVELDSYRYHRSRHAFEQDREREREARARGDEFRHYTWRDADERPEPMLEDLRKLLGPS
jgi:hypothetical protein